MSIRPVRAPRASWALAAAAALASLAFSAAAADGLPQLHFDRIGTEAGPPPGVITALLQDRNGYIWIGSRSGLFLFDGSTYTTFQHDPSNPRSLTDNTVRTIYEDRDGSIWIGTNTGGLNRYDPATGAFESYRHDGGDPASLSHDSIYAVCRDREGMLWVGTQKGLNRYDPASRKFLRMRASGPEGLANDYIMTIYEDRAGRLWVGTLGGGLHRWDAARRRFEVFRHDAADPRSIGEDRILSLMEDDDGRLWIGTFHGLSRIEPDGRTFFNIPPARGKPGGLPDDLVTALAPGAPGTLWVGTYRGGIVELETASGRLRTSRHDPARPDSLSSDSVMSLLTDRDGSLWVGTWGGGLNRLSHTWRQFTGRSQGEFPPFSAAGRDVTAILEDRQGGIWVGTRAGYLARLDPATGSYETVLRGGTEGTSRILANLLEDRRGRIWVATSGGLLRLDRKTGAMSSWTHDPAHPASLGPGYVAALLEDRSGGVWVGTGEGGLQRIDGDGRVTQRFVNDPGDPASLSDDYVTVLLEDRRGRLWVGTRSGGLNELDRATGRARRFVPVAEDASGLGHHHVTSLLEDARGRLWVGTAGGGLNRIETTDGGAVRIERVTEQDGLANNDVTGLVEDDDGSLWIATRRGLSRFDPESRAFTNFFLSDGLPSAEFEPDAATRSGAALYFGTVRGLVVMRAGTTFERPRPSPVVIRAIRTPAGEMTVGQGRSASDHVAIPYGSWLSVEMAVLDYIPEKAHRFAYRLAEEWVDIGDRREITFSALQPGRHDLRIQGRNSHGVWNEIATPLGVEVVPPFWMTWRFRLLVAALIVAAAFGAHWRRTSVLEKRNRDLLELHQQRERARQELDEAYQRLRRLTRRLEAAEEEERKRIARELHDEMGPSLTAVIINLRLLSAPQDREEIARRVDDTVDLVDRMIQKIRNMSLDLRPPLLDELGLVAALGGYLESVGDRAGIEIVMHGDKELGKLPAYMPITVFRIVQEAVTNVVRHANADHVDVVVRRDGAGIEVVVEDDGRGFDKNATIERALAGKAVGLLGMQERVGAAGGEIEIDSAPGEGTRIRARLPLSEAA